MHDLNTELKRPLSGTDYDSSQRLRATGSKWRSAQTSKILSLIPKDLFPSHPWRFNICKTSPATRKIWFIFGTSPKKLRTYSVQEPLLSMCNGLHSSEANQRACVSFSVQVSLVQPRPARESSSTLGSLGKKSLWRKLTSKTSKNLNRECAACSHFHSRKAHVVHLAPCRSSSHVDKPKCSKMLFLKVDTLQVTASAWCNCRALQSCVLMLQPSATVCSLYSRLQPLQQPSAATTAVCSPLQQPSAATTGYTQDAGQKDAPHVPHWFVVLLVSYF